VRLDNFADGFVGQASSYSDGQVPYSRNSKGAYYYLTAALTF